MLKLISKLILWIFGWKVKGQMPQGINKCVIIVAPHTSNLDFILGRLSFFTIEAKVKFLIKKEAFKFPFKRVLKLWGGIPVNRGSKNNLVSEIAELFDKYDSLLVTITPEGTRRLNHKWKKGFYHIAAKANIPIILGFLDYKNKCCGLGPIMDVSGDYDKDLREIEKFYLDKTARHPENFNLSPLNLSVSE
ncbi:MAG: 1-acyl-sn-glycerol-3-phosphate acyltransferase [Bacteroidales bacterium]|nr:1-acyl-sn-glycerol-3-phosphate acyltransferase [Bacteroidales bacterium]